MKKARRLAGFGKRKKDYFLASSFFSALAAFFSVLAAAFSAFFSVLAAAFSSFLASPVAALAAGVAGVGSGEGGAGEQGGDERCEDLGHGCFLCGIAEGHFSKMCCQFARQPPGNAAAP
jgi:hypothetical protein